MLTKLEENEPELATSQEDEVNPPKNPPNFLIIKTSPYNNRNILLEDSTKLVYYSANIENQV